MKRRTAGTRSRAGSTVRSGATHAGTYARPAWIFLAVSAGLHLVSYLHHRIHLHVLERPLPINRGLYAVAHVGVLNFVLDLPGRRIPDVRGSHVVILLGGLITGVYLFFVYITLVPLDDAWACYDPAVSSVLDYSHGLCSNPNICLEASIDCDRKKTAMSAAQAAAEQIVSGLLVVYFLSIPSKIAYYTKAGA